MDKVGEERRVARANPISGYSVSKATRGRVALQKFREKVSYSLFILHEVLWECGESSHRFNGN